MTTRKTPSELAILQNWMQNVITYPHGIEAGIESSEARKWMNVDVPNIESVVLPSQKRTSVQRLQVYGNAYFARLVDCLASVFPMFVRTVGEDVFYQFAREYLNQYPSSSYTLNRLADHFVEFLKKTNPSASSATPGFEHFLIDLATLERSIDQVFDGPGFESRDPLNPDSFAQIDPQDFLNCRFKTVPCLLLIDFVFPINSYFTAVRQSPDTPLPIPEPSWLALSRINFVVRRVPLSQLQFAMLQSLQNGKSVSEVIEAGLSTIEEPIETEEPIREAFLKFSREQFLLERIA